MADLADLVEPATTAVLCMEMQRGVVGDLALFPQAAEAAHETGLIETAARLFTAARAADIRVVHCIAGFRRDRAGSYLNMPFVNQLLENPDHLIAGSPTAEVVPELWDPERDVAVARLHGIAPWADTSLDSMLRSLAVTTLVVTGVSLNRGIIGMTMGGVDRNYRVVVATDAVAGYPADYAQLVIEHTLAAIAWLTTTDELVAAWA
jgi:nicotinamidase-related amidase